MSLISLLPLRLRAPRFQRLRLPLWLTSLRGNFILFLLLFCLLQCAGIVLLTRQVEHTSRNVTEGQIQRERLALLDKARIELLTASDNSHRAGIYLMQDQQSGSVDSWKSLAATADASLKQAQTLFAQYGAAPESEQHQSFALLVDGLNEQLKGLANNNMDSFFMVPMQAFQQQFNDAWFNEMKTVNQQVAAANGATLASLTQSRNLSLAVSALLFALLMAAGGLLLRGVIAPLRQAARQLQNIATGDLIPHGAQPRWQSQETRQLFLAMDEMRQGLQHIVLEINTIAHAVSSGAAQMQQHNDSLSEQHQAQNATAQSARVNKITQQILALDTQVQRNASMGEQNRQASEALMQQAVRLAQSVAQFRLERPAGEQA